MCLGWSSGKAAGGLKELDSTDAAVPATDELVDETDNVTQPATAPAASVEPPSIAADLRQLIDRQAELADGMERIAQSLTPLLTSQYEATLARTRALEQRILNRQERPTVVKLANLLTSSARLHSNDDVADHLSSGLIQVLEGLGYDQFGAVGQNFEESRHDVVDAVECSAPVVTAVHALGLQSGDDVIIRARVEVGPESSLDDE